MNYRRGVGGVIINNEGLIFVGKRNNQAQEWQMPQGGIEHNENEEEAIFREIYEEVGITNITIVGKTTPLRYNLPIDIARSLWNGKFVGQEQIWYFLKFNGIDADINLMVQSRPEFIDWKWLPHGEIINLTVFFKQDMYKEIINFGIENKILINNS